MTINLAHLGLAIDSPLVAEGKTNFRPNSWPPAPDFPIVLDAGGKVLSRYGDSVWDLTVWAGKSTILNFRDKRLCQQNLALLKTVVAWWLYGPSALQHPVTLRSAFYEIRPIFALCTSRGILASDLWRFPAIAGLIPWLLTNDPTWSVIIAVVIDLIGFIPTLRKAWNFPKTETPLLYGMNVARHILMLFSLQAYNIATMLHSVVMIITNTLMTSFIIFHKRTNSSFEK